MTAPVDRPSRPAELSVWLKFGVLGLLTSGLQVGTIWVGMQEPTNKLATAILQCATLVFGLYSSYIFGQVSATSAAHEIIRPHARASIRRVLNLYRALDRQQQSLSQQFTNLEGVARLDDAGTTVINLELVKWSMAGLQGLVVEQIATAADALEDWRDIAPDEVDRIRREVGGNV